MTSSKIAAPLPAELQNIVGLLQSQQLRTAEQKARKLVKRFPGNLAALELLSAAQLGQERYSDAVKTLRKMLQLNPDFVLAEHNLALALMNLERTEQAVGHFQHVIAKKPDFADAHNNLGAALFELDQFENAVEAYQNALALQPDLAPALRNIGTALRDLGRLQESKEYLTHLTKLQPKFAQGHTSLGITLRQQGDLEAAEQCFLTALKLDPQQPSAHNELANMLRNRREWEPALAAFEKVDTMTARVQVLEMLHEIGKRDELLSRLQTLNENEAHNLRAAALSAYISHQYEVANTHSFVSDPFEFVSVRNLASDLDQCPDFLSKLIEAADQLTVLWEHRTTMGGYQTYGNLFDPSANIAIFARLEKLVRRELEAYRQNFASRHDAIIRDFPRKYRLNGWRVKLMRSGYQKPHIHSGGWISGVVYLKIPEQTKDNEGAIAFSLHGYNYRKIRHHIPERHHMPKVGELVLFPSSLFHHTIPFASNEERQCIAFDVVPLRN